MITVQETFAGPRDFPLSGKFFRLLACVNPVDIKFSSGASPSEQADAVTAGFYHRKDFERVRVVAAPGGDTVKFIVSDGDTGIDTFSFVATLTAAGAPQGVDQVTSNGKAYGAQHGAGHVGANDAVCMIKNPAGSGKRIYVDAVRCSSFNTPLVQFAVILGATADGASVADGAIGVNKKTAAKDGSATFFRDFAGTALGGFVVDFLETPNIAGGGGEVLHVISPPIILDPGQRCHTAVPGGIAGAQNNTVWSYREY
jgi:hypothetical protein